jgi:hypothetical protein
MIKRSFRKNLQPIGDILSKAFQKRGMTTRFREFNIVRLWPKAVGEKIAVQTQPDGWREGTLFVRTTSSVWVQQLHFMKDEIRSKLNALAGKTVVWDIRFSVGYQPDVHKEEREAFHAQNAVLSDRDKKMIAECTESISDRELAEVVARVMQKEISRRRLREEKRDR